MYHVKYLCHVVDLTQKLIKFLTGSNRLISEPYAMWDINIVSIIKGNGLSSDITKGDEYFLALRDQFEGD